MERGPHDGAASRQATETAGPGASPDGDDACRAEGPSELPDVGGELRPGGPLESERSGRGEPHGEAPMLERGPRREPRRGPRREPKPTSQEATSNGARRHLTCSKDFTAQEGAWT